MDRSSPRCPVGSMPWSWAGASTAAANRVLMNDPKLVPGPACRRSAHDPPTHREFRAFARRSQHFAGALPGARVHGGPGGSHLPGPRVHCSDGAGDDGRSASQQSADGLRVRGVHPGLCGLRDAQRLLGRPHRPPAAADADRDLVVMLHDRHGGGVQLRVSAGSAVPLRHGRGRRVPQRIENLLALVPAHRTRHGSGNLLRGCAPGRRAHALAGDRHARGDVVADGVRGLRGDRLHLGGRLVPLVSRRTLEPSRGFCGRTAVHRGRARGRGPARPWPRDVLARRHAQEYHSALPHVLHPGVRLLLLHHLAADVSGEGPGLHVHPARAAGRLALDPQRWGRPGGRAGHRSRGPGVGSAPAGAGSALSRSCWRVVR